MKQIFIKMAYVFFTIVPNVRTNVTRKIFFEMKTYIFMHLLFWYAIWLFTNSIGDGEDCLKYYFRKKNHCHFSAIIAVNSLRGFICNFETEKPLEIAF